MTHKDLLELALLDSLSMLDDDERSAFEEAFHAAPPHIQAQVRREQARFARSESLLPDVSPPASLRARVVDAVRRAMALDPAEAPEHSLRLNDPDDISRLPALAHRRKVAALWRAVALGSVAAAVVLGVTTMHLQDVVQQLNSDRDPLLDVIKAEFGREHFIKALVDDSTSRVTMTSSSGTTQAQAAVWYNPDWQTARLFGINLPVTKNNHYKLVVTDSNGNPLSVVAEFDFDGKRGLLNHEFEITVSLDGDGLAILGESETGAESVLLGTPQAPVMH